MKKIFLLLLTGTGVFAQVSNPHSSTAVTGAERVASFTVSDAGNDRLEIANGTQVSSRFNPTIWSYKSTDNTYSLAITSAIASAMDTGVSPVMIFSTSVPNTFYPNAPTTGEFVWGDSGGTNPVAVRPLFEWRNASAKIMTILANKNIGIGTTAPSAILHTNGTLRFQSLPTVTTNQYILTADVNGNVSRQLATGFTTGTFIMSDQVYKTKVEGIQNSLGIINSLDGVTYWSKQQESPELNLENKMQYGLIAQQVEKVIPDVVQTSDEGIKAVDYTAIVPILIEAVKQQQAQIAQLQGMLSAQFKSENEMIVRLSNTMIVEISPNPSSDQAVIALNIDDQAENVQLVISDLKGVFINSITVKEKGLDIRKTINRDNFGAGTYIVSLMVNGKSLDSKKIIFK